MSLTASSHRGSAPDLLNLAIQRIGQIVLGKETEIRLCLACLLARGHLLIEDIPGVGKTTLAHTLARTLGLSYQRIQFTSDMLPADIIGASVYQRDTGEFRFYPGPVFAQVVLADEVNRSTPKTQSALLEAMEEHQVTVEGETRRLPEPFFVIATQNPNYQVGTFPLPESQLDRFLMSITLGYPDRAAERELLRGDDRRRLLEDLEPALTPGQMQDFQRQVVNVHVSDALLDYLQALVRFSRESGEFETGLSPRAALALLSAARAWAFMAGRRGVVPEDLQTILPGVVAHRVRLRDNPATGRARSASARLLEAVAIP